jgi:TonB family protein
MFESMKKLIPLLLWCLLGHMNASAQVATMYMPYRYALPIDTAVWSVPYLVPCQADYTGEVSTQIYHRPTQTVFNLIIKDTKAFGEDQWAEAEKWLQSRSQRNNQQKCSLVRKDPFLTPVHVQNGYQEIAGAMLGQSDHMAYYTFMCKGDTVLARQNITTIEHQLKTLTTVAPREIDRLAHLPATAQKDIDQHRLFCIDYFQKRMKLHGDQLKFYSKSQEYYWIRLTQISLEDQPRFDSECVMFQNPEFSFQAVADELERLNQLPIPEKAAIQGFLNPSSCIHDAYKTQCLTRAKSIFSERYSLQLQEKCELLSSVHQNSLHPNFKILTLLTDQKSYLLTAYWDGTEWAFKPHLLSDVSALPRDAKVKLDFTRHNLPTSLDKTGTLRMPIQAGEAAIAFGVVAQYRKAGERVECSPSKRFVIPLEADHFQPHFLPAFDIAAYDVTFEMQPKVINFSNFSGGPFSMSTTFQSVKYDYSIFYRDQNQIENSRVNSNQKLAIDDPLKRAYISSMHATDYNRNGNIEYWMALVVNGQIRAVHGVEKTSKGWGPMVVSDSFRSLIKLEKQIAGLLDISLQKQDPFAVTLAASNPYLTDRLYDHLESGGSGSGNGEGGYHSGYNISETVKETEMDMDGPVETLPPDEEAVYGYAQEMPLYPGGIDSLQQEIQNNIVYPEMEKENGIQGKVYVQFVVEKDGLMTNAKVVRGISGGPALSKAALDALNKAKHRWTPGKQNGKVVPVSMTIPIKFSL